MKVLFRVDCSNEIGFGHVYRCLSLAQELKALSPNLGIAFCMRDNPHARELLKKQDFPLLPVQDNAESAIQDYKPDIFIGDVRDGLSPKFVRELSKRGALTVAIDEPSDYRRSVDLAFYPPTLALQRLNWDGFEGKIFSGWEYAIIRKEFSTPSAKPDPSRLQAVVTFGGSDPEGWAIKTAQWLGESAFQGTVNVLLGSSQSAKLDELNRSFAGKARFYYRPPDLINLMAASNFAVCAFGVSAFELAALGVPAIHVARSKDHWQSSLPFSSSGMAVSLCEYSQYNKSVLEKAIQTLVGNPLLLKEMAKNCQAVKADGGRQIAEIILSSVPKGT